MQTSRSQTQQTTQKVKSVSFYSAVFFLLPSVLALVAGIVVFIVVLSRGFSRKKETQQKRLSRAECLVRIMDILNGSNLPAKDKIKSMGRLLATEGDKAGWRCRIVVEENPVYLPPTGKSLGEHIPLIAGNAKLGTLIVSSAEVTLDPIDRTFFETLARSLSFFLLREKTWNNFHSEVKQWQANLLLNQLTTPDGAVTVEPPSAEPILKILEHRQ
ncbi:MAG: hypothetical protein KCHDKBKB_02691 [Elusimicrobia bacterium]|nr:hypothetical protein [Elusimicrobiota bacterium]